MSTDAPTPLSSLWVDLDRALAATLIGEATPAEASDRMVASLSRHLGGACSMVPGHVAASSSSSSSSAGASVADPLCFELGTVDDVSATTLILDGDGSGRLNASDRDRLRKVFRALHDLGYPIPSGAKAIHQLRNRLAGVLTNIEFLEMAMDQGPDGSAEQREEIAVAMRHAIMSCREMAELVRSLAGLFDAQKRKK